MNTSTGKLTSTGSTNHTLSDSVASIYTKGPTSTRVHSVSAISRMSFNDLIYVYYSIVPNVGKLFLGGNYFVTVYSLWVTTGTAVEGGLLKVCDR